MNNNVLGLRASKFENTLRISIRTPTNLYSEDIEVDFKKIEETSRILIESINKNESRILGSQIINEDIKRVGSILCDLVLTNTIKNMIKSENCDYLLLEIDDSLVHIPWELIYLGDDFLCMQYHMGREVIHSKNSGPIKQRKITLPLKMWLIAEPQGNLEGVNKEIDDIEAVVAEINKDKKRIDLTIDRGDFRALTPELIHSKLRDFDIIHFAGHSEYCHEYPELSGWKLTKGFFTAQYVKKMIGSASMPIFIFPNACQSARTQHWDLKHDTFDLAHSFTLAGVKHYLGTFWNIMDKSSSDFSIELYKHLFSGKTYGEAVRNARVKLLASNTDVTWASYVLYGDPTEKCIDNETTTEPPTGPTGEVGGVPTIIKRGGWPTLKKVKLPFFWLGIALIVLCIIPSTIVIHRYLQAKQQAVIQQLLIKQDTVLKQEVDKLFQDLFEIIGQSPFRKKCPDINDNWSSNPLGIAIIHDIDKGYEENTIETDISLSLEKEIRYKTRLKVLCRMPKQSIHMLKEIIRVNQSSNSKKGNLLLEPQQANLIVNILPQLQQADMMLYVSLYTIESKSFIGMKLLNVFQMSVIESFREVFNKKEFLVDRKTNFSNRLIQFLQKTYPLQGKIVKKQAGTIELNIGNESGVKLNQLFKVIEKDYTIQISDSTSCTSTVTNISGNVIENDWRVRCIDLNH